MLALLLENGADPNWTPSEQADIPLAVAAREGNIEAVTILLAHGARVNGTMPCVGGIGGTTALDMAIRTRSWAIVRLLLERGARKSTCGDYSPTDFALNQVREWMRLNGDAIERENYREMLPALRKLAGSPGKYRSTDSFQRIPGSIP